MALQTIAPYADIASLSAGASSGAGIMGMFSNPYIAGAGLGLQVLGMMKGAGGMSGAGAAAMQAAEYNAKIRERNAKIAEQAAEYRERVGEMEVVDFRGKFAKLQARAGTAYRKAGVQAGTGTPLRVLADNANEAAKQVQRIQITAVAEAGRHREQARHERFAGQLALLSGQQQAAAYRTRGQSDLFGGLGSLLFSAAQFGQAGGFGQIGN